METGRVRRPTQDFGWSTSGSNDPATASPRYPGSRGATRSSGATAIHPTNPTTTCDRAIMPELALVSDQSNARDSVSATSAGLSLPSISTVLSNVSRTPPSISSTAFSICSSRTRDPAGTGAVNRTLFDP